MKLKFNKNTKNLYDSEFHTWYILIRLRENIITLRETKSLEDSEVL